jgi:hypothetical protein
MRDRIVVGIWMLTAGSVSIAPPVVAHARPQPCRRSRATRPAQPVVTVPRGITATISGVTNCRRSRGRFGHRSLVAGLQRGQRESVRRDDSGTFEADKLWVSRNKGPGLTVTTAEAVIRGGLIHYNFSNGEGGAGVLVVGGRVELGHKLKRTTRFGTAAACLRCRRARPAWSLRRPPGTLCLCVTAVRQSTASRSRSAPGDSTSGSRRGPREAAATLGPSSGSPMI